VLISADSADKCKAVAESRYRFKWVSRLLADIVNKRHLTAIDMLKQMDDEDCYWYYNEVQPLVWKISETMVGVLGPGLLEGQGLVMAAIQFLFLSADQDCSTNDVTFATELLNLITLSVDDPHGLTEKTPGGKEPRVTTGKKRAPTAPNHEEARALQIAHALQEEREVLRAEQEARRHPVAPVEARRRQAEEAYYREIAEHQEQAFVRCSSRRCCS
jgi:hypothetical protein